MAWPWQLGALVLLDVLATHSLAGASSAQLAVLPTAEYLTLAVVVNVTLAFARRHGSFGSQQETWASPPTALSPDEDEVRRIWTGPFGGQSSRPAWAAGAAAAAATALRVVRFSTKAPPILSHALEVRTKRPSFLLLNTTDSISGESRPWLSPLRWASLCCRKCPCGRQLTATRCERHAPTPA